jgi:hypothetical protein
MARMEDRPNVELDREKEHIRMYWINLAQNSVQLWAVANAVKSIRVS